MDVVIAPFTEEQVESINAFQGDGSWHPFTCPKCGIRLKASTVTIQCYGCGKYMQTWVHRFMADWSWRDPKYFPGDWVGKGGEGHDEKR
jgi:hypothetical protein